MWSLFVLVLLVKPVGGVLTVSVAIMEHVVEDFATIGSNSSSNAQRRPRFQDDLLPVAASPEEEHHQFKRGNMS